MHNDLIHKASKLMREQAASYFQLQTTSSRLGEAMVLGDLALIESCRQSCERELFPMRARLVQLMSTLAVFSEERAKFPDNQIAADARNAFESASKELLDAARTFQRTQKLASTVATNGATLTSAFIEMCGVQPTTYRAPYARRTEGRRWA
jgi:hypothetical protein